MPDEVLTLPDEDDRRPVAGLFGKLPATGDFVWRGLPDTFRKQWDFWLTRHVAPFQRHGHRFPDGGLRFRLPSGNCLASGLILPSQDSTGRQFPLSLLLIADGDLTPAQLDPWCDAALALHPEALLPEDLWIALDGLPAPEPLGSPSGPMQLWSPAHPVLTVDPANPAAALQALLSS